MKGYRWSREHIIEFDAAFFDPTKFVPGDIENIRRKWRRQCHEPIRSSHILPGLPYKEAKMTQKNSAVKYLLLNQTFTKS